MSPWHERITAMSSMQLADVREQVGDLDAALAVLLERAAGAEQLGVALDRTDTWRRRTPSGRGWPSSLFSSGLGSKVSRWLGPPAMNRKMTDFALAGMWAGLGARGSSTPARSCSWCRTRRGPGRRSRRRRRGRTRGGCGSGGNAGGRHRTYRNPLRLNIARANSSSGWSRGIRARPPARPASAVGRGASRKADRPRGRSPPASSPSRRANDRGEVVRERAVEQLQRLRRVGARLPPGTAGQQPGASNVSRNGRRRLRLAKR